MCIRDRYQRRVRGSFKTLTMTDTAGLQSLKPRVEDLRNSIIQLRMHFRENPSDLMSQFAVIAAQLNSIHQDLNPVLVHFVVEPESIPEGMDPTLIPELLRTKLLPEIEKKEQEFLDDARRRKVSTSNGQFVIEENEDQLTFSEFNQICDSIAQPIRQQKKKVLLSKVDSQTSRSNPTQLEELLRKLTTGKGLRLDPIPSPPPTVQEVPAHPEVVRQQQQVQQQQIQQQQQVQQPPVSQAPPAGSPPLQRKIYSTPNLAYNVVPGAGQAPKQYFQPPYAMRPSGMFNPSPKPTVPGPATGLPPNPINQPAKGPYYPSYPSSNMPGMPPNNVSGMGVPNVSGQNVDTKIFLAQPKR
eukprot:TRINITY_DN239_c0_g1_i1.p1 TRINITY_DN239_c0_g1~~TRINITY_DN239_c0_g1_i1.p1  ORF type:complete len:355 (+),score=109.52 TRINITY_DN239_c0_g1_i1:39-1103(+)